MYLKIKYLLKLVFIFKVTSKKPLDSATTMSVLIVKPFQFTLLKISLFHIISCSGNFVGRQFPKSFERIVRVVPFYKISTPGN